MGRGRQKAKQTKVARELKYYSPETDYAKLQRELTEGGGLLSPPPVSRGSAEPVTPAATDGDDDDQYEDWTRR